MRVFEILREDAGELNEAQITERLKSFNWKYEFSNNMEVFKRGQRELELLENQVFKLWKKNPSEAVRIWNTYSAEGSADKTVTPSFIFRLQAQDN